MEESKSERDCDSVCERSLSRREVDELIDSIIKNPTASQKIRIKSSSRGRAAEALCSTPNENSCKN